MKLGVRKVIVASSETTYGVCFAEGDKDFHSFPLEEDYDRSDGHPRPLQGCQREDRAGLRRCGIGADIYALRIGNVIEPHEYDRSRVPGRPDVPQAQRWSYIDARDLGEIVHSAWRRTDSAIRCSTPSTIRSR